MAWRSSGATNADLISNLFRNGLTTTPRVRDAMLKVRSVPRPSHLTSHISLTFLCPPGRPRPLLPRPLRRVPRLPAADRPRSHDLRATHARLGVRIAAAVPPPFSHAAIESARYRLWKRVSDACACGAGGRGRAGRGRGAYQGAEGFGGGEYAEERGGEGAVGAGEGEVCGGRWEEGVGG